MDIQDTLRKYIADERFSGQLPAHFDDDFDLINSGTLDSVFLVGLITYVERQYNFEFGMNELVPKHFKSVKALADCVRSKAK